MFKKLWHPSMIINHILSRKDKEALNSYYYATTYPDVYAAAEREFGSWKDAIEACGLDYSLIRKYKTWTRQAVIEEIKKAYEEGEQINSQHMQNNNKALYMAAVKRFRSWAQAVKLAGIDYDKVRLRRSMTKAQIKHEILELFRKRVDLSYTNMRENYQYLLAAGMKKLGNGSWASARRECGILTNFRLRKEKRGEPRRF
ncbi:MAG: hypothetical protein JXR78_11835 [Victivallales bacterium]|nr:hypothetical protein [Victivallales bacterium]